MQPLFHEADILLPHETPLDGVSRLHLVHQIGDKWSVNFVVLSLDDVIRSERLVAVFLAHVRSSV